ncbi:MAG: hypothetical protein FK733_13590 [Asgard group archaeon]|nr:hypothetical protein [Asgard group archaeon]
MKKLDLIELLLGEPKQSFQEKWFNRLLETNETPTKESVLKKINGFFRNLWRRPESQVVIFLLLIRIVFVIFSSWGMDFEFYIEIAQRVLAGERLYTHIDSTHMPLVDLIYIAMYFICPWKSNVFALRIFLKFPFVLTDIGIALAVMKIIENEIVKRDYNNQVLDEESYIKVRRSKLVAGYLVAFSLPLIFQTGGGRYDSLMIFCFAMTILCMQKNSYFGVAFYAALGSSTKYIGIIFLPFVVIWMKKEDIVPFILGLLLGFLPIYPFLITIPTDFINAILLRDSHIAFGLSIWHGIKIIVNGFSIDHINSIEDTYASANEPWYIQRLYLPMFIIIYLTIFILFIVRYRRDFKTKNIADLPLVNQVNLVFIPLFIFALSFKALNIQVLAWFTPYFALRRKWKMMLEYSALTLVHGFAWILYSAYNPSTFQTIGNLSTGDNSIIYLLIVKPALFITQYIPAVVWVVLILITILWFVTRTSYEFVMCNKEFLKRDLPLY